MEAPAIREPRAGSPSNLHICKYAYPAEQTGQVWQTYAALGQLISRLDQRPFIAGSLAEGFHIATRQELTGFQTPAETEFMSPLVLNQNHEACCSGKPFEVRLNSTDPLDAQLMVKCEDLKRSIIEKCPGFDGTYLPKSYFKVTEPPLTLTDRSDHIQSVVLDSWPEPVQSRWQGRARRFGWPSKALVARVTEEKIMATVTDRLGENGECIWRLSFSMAERVLAVSLTAAQRSAFVLWKWLLKDLISSKVLQMFHLKNAFFWVCENNPAKLWRADNIETCLTILCRALSRRIQSKRLCSFFAPDSYLPGSDDIDVTKVCRKLKLLGRSPLKHFQRRTCEVNSFSSFLLEAPCYDIIFGPSFESSLSPACKAVKLVIQMIKTVKPKIKQAVCGRAATLYDKVLPELGVAGFDSLLYRLIVDSGNPTRSSAFSGNYRLSTEMKNFRHYRERTCEEAEYKLSRKMSLMADALFKMKLRGQDPLETGSFAPIAEYQCKLVTAAPTQFMTARPEGLCALVGLMFQSATTQPGQQRVATSEILHPKPEKALELIPASTDVLDVCKYAYPNEQTCRDWHEFAAVAAVVVQTNQRIFIAGSRAEGLHVTEYLRLVSGSSAIADWDMMIPAGLNQNHAGCCDSRPLDIRLDPADRRYAELFIKCESLRKSVIEVLPGHDGSYVPREYIRTSEPLPAYGDLSAPVAHGPAETRTGHPDHAKKYAGIQRSVIVHLEKLAPVTMDIDHVQAVVLDTWPEQIKEDWLRRPRPHGWPSEALVERVTKEKVMATLKGRPGEDGDRTWRLSFSMAELVVSLSLTATQRTAFVQWKLLLKEMPATKRLRSFYLKNMLYWVCENQPADTWRAENMETCLRTLCNSLSECVASKRLGSFFVPDSNLLIEENIDAAAVCEDLKRLGRNPSHYLQRNSGKALGMGSVTLAFDAHDLAARQNLGRSSPELTLDAAGKAAKFLMVCLKFHKAARDDDSLYNLCFLNVDEICWHSLISRLIVDSWSNTRQWPATGEYRLSDDMAKFQEYFRRVYETANCFPSRRIKLLAEAFCKSKLRGQDPLDTGAFIPILEYQYKLSLLMSSGILKRKTTKPACKYTEDEVD